MSNSNRNRETAAECYDRVRGDIAIQLRDLKLNLARYGREFHQTDQRNWGYAGTLADILLDLKEINERFSR